jgi:hypothetical protein
MTTAIIFTHHKVDDVVLNNYNRIKQFNPDKQIYTVGFKNMDLLPNSFIVDDSQEYLPKNIKAIRPDQPNFIYWTQADLLIYDFAHHNELIYDRYLLLEWDTWCNCSIEEFYGDSLKKETFGHTMHYPSEDKWVWYEMLTEEQKNKFLIFGGYTPTSGLLFSKDLLIKMNEHIIKYPRRYDDVFSELRLGSIIKSLKGYLDTPFHDAHTYMNWKSDLILFDKNKKGYYHPIKTIV